MVTEAATHERRDREVEKWFLECLGCVPGQREFKLGRYMYGFVDGSGDVRRLFDELKARTEDFSKVGCLFVFDGARFQSRKDDDLSRILAEVGAVMADGLGLSPATAEGTGQSLTATLALRCPVTNQRVEFDDFDAIAFVPHAGDVASRFYDPNIDAPFVCVNFTSDLYGFSVFTRDRANGTYGCEAWEISGPAERETLFERSAELWQRLALKTIRNFASRTDESRLCPIHASNDGRHWYAMHEDAAFGEMLKRLHVHEMPKIYTTRVIEEWRSCLERGSAPRLVGLAPKGREVTDPQPRFDTQLAETAA